MALAVERKVIAVGKDKLDKIADRPHHAHLAKNLCQDPLVDLVLLMVYIAIVKQHDPRMQPRGRQYLAAQCLPLGKPHVVRILEIRHRLLVLKLTIALEHTLHLEVDNLTNGIFFHLTHISIKILQLFLYDKKTELKNPSPRQMPAHRLPG